MDQITRTLNRVRLVLREKRLNRVPRNRICFRPCAGYVRISLLLRTRCAITLKIVVIIVTRYCAKTCNVIVGLKRRPADDCRFRIEIS